MSNIQTIDLADNINAAIDKINENFELVGGSTITYSDSDISANAEAILELTTRINETDSGISILAQAQIATQAQLDNFVLEGIDEDLLASAIASANTTLTSRIDANSDSLVSFAGVIDSVENDLLLRDSTTNDRIDINTSAINSLTSRIAVTESDLSVVVADTTQLSLDLNQLITDGITITPEQITQAVGGALEELTLRLNADSDKLVLEAAKVVDLDAKLTALDSDTGAEIQAEADARGELSATVSLINGVVTSQSRDLTELSASVDSDIASVRNDLQAVVDDQGNTTATWNLDLVAGTEDNPRIAGIKFGNDGATADFAITTDNFKIVNASNNNIQPFSIEGDQIALNGDVTINGTLSTTQLVGDVAEFYSFSRGTGANDGTVGSFGLTTETQEIYIPPPTGGVAKRPFIDGRIILSPFSNAQYQNYEVEIRYVSGPTFTTTLTGYLGDRSSSFSGRRNYARYSGNYSNRIVNGGLIYTASDDARGFYGANYDLTADETLFLYDDDDGPIGNNAVWTLAPSSATSTSDLNKIGVTNGGGTGDNARIHNVVIPFSGVLPSTTAPQGITLAITWKTYGYAGAFNGYLRSLEATYGYQR